MILSKPFSDHFAVVTYLVDNYLSAGCRSIISYLGTISSYWKSKEVIEVKLIMQIKPTKDQKLIRLNKLRV